MPILHHEAVVAPGATPRSWLHVLHGVYGSGRNWGTVARQLVRERPDWGCLLIDLRQHGASHGFPPPHSLASAAGDLLDLERFTGNAPRAVLGHSFGGKVALAYLRQAARPPEQVWVVDSTPDAGEPRGSAWAMFGILRALPERFESREDAIEAMVSSGTTEQVAQWMATNLERSDDGFRWKFELDALEQMLRDFFQTDLWSVAESPPAGAELHVVKATESNVLTDQALARLEAAGPRVHVHRVPGGHWINADNPAGMVALLAARLPGSS